MPGVNSWVDDAINGRGAYDSEQATRAQYAANLARYGPTGAAAPGTPGIVPYADLANQLNTFMAGQAQAPYLANLPGYGANLAQQSGSTGSLLRGEVPLDVRNQIQQSGAERGISTGSPGSSNANAAWLRALGLTSLGLQDQGSKQFSQQQADLPVPELFNPSSLFIPQTLAADTAAYARQGQSYQSPQAVAATRQAQSDAWNANRAPTTTYSNFMGSGLGTWR